MKLRVKEIKRNVFEIQRRYLDLGLIWLCEFHDYLFGDSVNNLFFDKEEAIKVAILYLESYERDKIFKSKVWWP